MWTDDPVRDAIRHDREQQQKLDRLPKCDICGEPIQDTHYYLIDGEVLCTDCLNDNFRIEIED